MDENQFDMDETELLNKLNNDKDFFNEIMDKVVANPFENPDSDRNNFPSLEPLLSSLRKGRKNKLSSITENFSDENANSKNSNSNSKIIDSSEKFSWSVDQIARLLPANIQYRLQEDSLTIFKTSNPEVQEKVDKYFQSIYLPSPFTPSSNTTSFLTNAQKSNSNQKTRTALFSNSPAIVNSGTPASKFDFYYRPVVPPKFENEKSKPNNNNLILQHRLLENYSNVLVQTDITANNTVSMTSASESTTQHCSCCFKTVKKSDTCIIFSSSVNNLETLKNLDSEEEEDNHEENSDSARSYQCINNLALDFEKMEIKLVEGEEDEEEEEGKTGMKNKDIVNSTFKTKKNFF